MPSWDMRALLASILRLRMTFGYALALLVVATALLIEGRKVQDRVVEQASTNLHNLHQGHLDTLLGSAFVTDTGPIYLWLPGLVCILALAELQWHSGRLALTFVLGHIGTTLIVGLGLAVAVWLHWMPMSIARVSDVGMSYGASAVVGALTPAIPARWRSAWTAGLVTVCVMAILCNQTFTEVGHLVALTLGMVVGHWLPLPESRWTTMRLVLLAGGGSFAVMMFCEDALTAAAALPTGAAAALLAAWISGRRPRDRRAIA